MTISSIQSYDILSSPRPREDGYARVFEKDVIVDFLCLRLAGYSAVLATWCWTWIAISEVNNDVGIFESAAGKYAGSAVVAIDIEYV